jgi:hypothetical protein
MSQLVASFNAPSSPFAGETARATIGKSFSRNAEYASVLASGADSRHQGRKQLTTMRRYFRRSHKVVNACQEQRQGDRRDA